MMLCILENIIRVNCNQNLLQNHITSASRDVKVRDGSENVRHKIMYRDCVLYPSLPVYLNIVSMDDSFVFMITLLGMKKLLLNYSIINRHTA